MENYIYLAVGSGKNTVKITEYAVNLQDLYIEADENRGDCKMKTPMRRSVDGERKYTVRCMGAALIFFLILSLISEALILALQTLSLAVPPFFVLFVHAYDGIRLVLNIVKFTLPVCFYLRMAKKSRLVIHRPRENTAIYRVERWSRASKVLFFLFAAAITVAVTNFVGAITEEVYYQLGMAVPSRSLITSPIIAVLFFLSSVIATPIMEECLFRGVTMNALSPYGMRWTVLGSGVLFALMHGTVYQLFYAFFAGCCIAFFAYISNSLRVAVGLHFVNNLMTFAVIFARDWFRDGKYEQKLIDAFTSVTVTLAIVGVIYFAVRKPWHTVTPGGGGNCGEPDGSQNEALGGGNCGEPDGSQSKEVLGSPVCGEIIFYAVFAFLACFL